VNIILSGITGSRAHGLERPDSDTDRRGIYAAPTRQILGLGKMPYSTLTPEGHVLWEAGNAVRLALASNPHLLELLFLPEHEVIDRDGAELAHLRTRLVSREAVRHSYLSNAESQYRRLQSRLRFMSKFGYRPTAEQEEADLRFVRKRARHIALTLIQGVELWRTGTHLPVRMGELDRQVLMMAEANPQEELPRLIRDATEILNGSSPLPEEPDREAAEGWLLRVRERNWKHAE
jgi:uncharacterized protein